MTTWEFSFSGVDNNITKIRNIEASTFKEAVNKLSKKELEKTLCLMQEKIVVEELKKEFELEINFSKTVGNKHFQKKEGIVLASLTTNSLDELVSKLDSLTKEELQKQLAEKKSRLAVIDSFESNQSKLCVMCWEDLGEEEIKKLLEEKSGKI